MIQDKENDVGGYTEKRFIIEDKQHLGTLILEV